MSEEKKDEKAGGEMAAIEELERFAKAMSDDAEDDAPPPKKGKKEEEEEEDEKKKDEEEDAGKSFQFGADGPEFTDAAPLLKSLTGRIDKMERLLTQIAEGSGALAKGLATTGRMVASVRETVDSYANGGRGRKSVTDPAAAGGALGGVKALANPGEILMKSLDLVEKGKLTAADVSEIELAVRMQRLPHPRFHGILGIAQQQN